jgi:hypothetical protein
MDKRINKPPIPSQTLNLDGESGKRGFFPDQSRSLPSNIEDDAQLTKDLITILLDSVKLPIDERVKFLNEASYHISCALHEANTHSQHDIDQQYNER